jgi:hypothetical protein
MSIKPPRMRPSEAASYLKSVHGVNAAPGTLNKLRCLGGGPKFEHFGRLVYYRPEYLDHWVPERLSPSSVRAA